MHGEITLLEVIFRCFLFALLLYKLYDIAQTYFLPLLKNHISKEHKQQTELLEKDKLLISTRYRIENQMYNQKQLFVVLEKNVKQWHEHHEATLNNNAKKQQSSIDALVQKRKTQKKNLTLYNTVALTLPRAVKKAEDLLSKQYSSNTNEKILESMVNALPKTLKKVT